MDMDIFGGAPPSGQREAIAKGIVVEAPASNDDALSVVVAGFTSDFDYLVPPGNWARAAILPAAGAACLIVFDDNGDAWVPVIHGTGP